MRKLATFFSLGSVIFLLACIGSNGRGKEYDPEALFFDYKISGEENNDSITILLQFKVGGEFGPTVSIDAPGAVTLDGRLVPADSTPMTGPFYEARRHINDFIGTHSIQVITPEKKKYKENFSFRPFSLKTTLADTITRGRLIFEFTGLANVDYLRTLLTDTSFTGEGINRIDTVIGNRLVITKSDLTALGNGPIQLEFSKEDEKEVENGTEEGGILSVTYRLRREFFLKDPR